MLLEGLIYVIHLVCTATWPATVICIAVAAALASLLRRRTLNVIKNRRSSKSSLMVQQTIAAEGDAAEVIIVGSGILGSSLAAVLGRDGRKVTVIERDLKEPDRIVGELLQPGGCQALRKLGLGDCLEGLDAQWTSGYVIQDMVSKTSVRIPYPTEGEVEGQGSCIKGVAFKHGRFVNALRMAAQRESNVTYIEGTAVKLVENNEGAVTGVQYRTKDSSTLQVAHAPLTVVADGLFSKFRKELAQDPESHTSSHFVGFLMTDCPQIRPGHAELLLTDPNPVLVYKITSTETRVLVDLRGPLPKDLRCHLLEEVAPLVPDHLRESFEEGARTMPVRYMPCTHLSPSHPTRPGALLLGDAFNTRHPLTGGGMSVALGDVALWRELLKGVDVRDTERVGRVAREFDWRRRKEHSFVVNVLAQALYELFSAEDDDLKQLKAACFGYFQLGGSCVTGPVGLLSVLSPRPLTLIGHFFAVAVYAIVQTFKKKGWAVHSAVYRSTLTFAKACQVILPLIWSEIRIYATF